MLSALVSQAGKADHGSWLVAQTNDDPMNADVVRFYRDRGFTAVGTKLYADKRDVVLARSLKSSGLLDP